MEVATPNNMEALSPPYEDPAEETIEIPLKDSQQVIELNLSQLPSSEEVITILKAEQATLDIWIRLAEAYYTHSSPDDFAEVLESARSEANLMYEDHERDQVICLDKLAAYYVMKSKTEKVGKRRDELKQQATQLYTMADKISMYDIDHLLGRACFCLQDRGKIDQAEQQFTFVLEHDKNNTKAMLGQAAIAFDRKEYRKCLNWYRKALKTNPGCQDPSIRIGLGICYYKLSKMEKSKSAFKRALELDQKSVGALIGLAILELNTKFQGGDSMENNNKVKQGVQLLSQAYQVENENPLVLIHLADHFFHKKEYNRTDKLAHIVIKVSDQDEIKAEANYQLGRSYHAQGDFDKAYSFYYKSTQLALQCYQNYVLPFYGLGQLLIHRSKNVKEQQKIIYLNQAIDCFERVLSKYPNNYESMKILGTLYQQFSDFKPSTKIGREEIKFQPDEAYKKAVENYKKITETQKDDVEVIIAYAELLQRTDINTAIEQYEYVNRFYRDEFEVPPPAEILNNLANLYMKRQEFGKVKRFFDEAIESLDAIDRENGHAKGSPETVALRTTIRYNLARFYERTHEQQSAIVLYKKITKQVPRYIDCHLRLGIIYKQRGDFFEADEWFKEAININKDSADTWALMGNLRFRKNEWGPGQKHFEKIIKQHNGDTYALLSLANLWINMYYQSSQSAEKSARRLSHSESLFRDILKKDEKNIFAACGLGCILALKKHFAQATEVFMIVREASGAAVAGDTSERQAIHKDVWLNLGHVFMDQAKFAAACTVYESAIRKYDLIDDEEVLLGYAKALFKLCKFEQCRKIILKARHLNPRSQIIMYDLAILLKASSQRVLQSEKSGYHQIKSAVGDLKQANSYFEYLKDRGEKTVFHFPKLATAEAKLCGDSIIQAEGTLRRAQKTEQIHIEKRLEIQARKAQERELLKLEKLKLVEQKRVEGDKRKAERMAQIERTRNLAGTLETAPEQFSKRGHKGGDDSDGEGRPKKGRKKKSTADHIVDSDSDNEGGEKVKKPRKKKNKNKSGIDEEDGFLDDDGADFIASGRKKDKQKADKIKQVTSGVNQNKIKSRATIDTSSDDSSADEKEAKTDAAKVGDDSGSSSDGSSIAPIRKTQIGSDSSDDDDSSDAGEKKIVKTKPGNKRATKVVADSSGDSGSDDTSDEDTKPAAKQKAAISDSDDSD